MHEEIKIFNFENVIAKVHIPSLAEKEHKRRMKAVHKAAADLLKGISEDEEEKIEKAVS